MIGRGEIHWASLEDQTSSAPGKRRPVLVISADAYNHSAISTVTVVAVTSNERLADAPGNVLLSPDVSGLTKLSVANVSAIITLDKRRLDDRVGALDVATMATVDSGLRRALDLA